jgi:hypothetical protein
MERIELKEKVLGFTERDLHSKAILNTDAAGLLRYKIQRQKSTRLNEGVAEVQRVREELLALKGEMSEIKQLLLKITNRE